MQKAQAPVTIQRQPDGRHAVMDAGGAVMGMHKSPFSAARQLHDYFGPVVDGDTEPAQEVAAAKHVGSKQEAALQRPKAPRPSVKPPVPVRPKIPRP
jgi:hypothetical protein